LSGGELAVASLALPSSSKCSFRRVHDKISELLIERKSAMESLCNLSVSCIKRSPKCAEWYPILTAPLDRNLQLSVQEKGEVHSLVFTCRRTQKGWVNAQTGKPVIVHPTHWRDWLD